MCTTVSGRKPFVKDFPDYEGLQQDETQTGSHLREIFVHGRIAATIASTQFPNENADPDLCCIWLTFQEACSRLLYGDKDLFSAPGSSGDVVETESLPIELVVESLQAGMEAYFGQKWGMLLTHEIVKYLRDDMRARQVGMIYRDGMRPVMKMDEEKAARHITSATEKCLHIYLTTMEIARRGKKEKELEKRYLGRSVGSREHPPGFTPDASPEIFKKDPLYPRRPK